jgi:hypothetical protein
MGNANVIPSDVLSLCLDYFDIYDQLIQVKNISQLNKKYHHFIQYENVNLWINLSKHLSGCMTCANDAEAMFYSSLTTTIPTHFLITHTTDDRNLDLNSLWDQYCDHKKLLFWKSMCKTYLSHRR